MLDVLFIIGGAFVLWQGIETSASSAEKNHPQKTQMGTD